MQNSTSSSSNNNGSWGNFGKVKTIEKIEKKITKEIEEYNSLSLEEKIERVSDKLLKLVKPENLNEVQDDKLKLQALSLCDRDELIKQFFNYEYNEEVYEYFKPNSKTISKSDHKQANYLLSSNSTSDGSVSGVDNVGVSGSGSVDGGDVDSNRDPLRELAFSEEFQMDLKQQKENKRLKIKLIIVENAQSEKEKHLRHIVAPVLSALHLAPDFGLFHTALVVGPFYLDWNNRQLVIPKKCTSRAAITTFDIDSNLDLADYEYVVEKLSETICRWNVIHTYNQSQSNCQHFVDEALVSLGIDPQTKFKGQLGQFMNNLRKTGHEKMTFEVSSELLSKLKHWKDKTITFKSHKQLDQFVKDILEADPEFLQNKSGDMLLLKGFDRAFWLRHFSDRYNNAYLPLEFQTLKAKDGCLSFNDACPFENPLNTKSFTLKKL